jgi:hypothetical protein
MAAATARVRAARRPRHRGVGREIRRSWPWELHIVTLPGIPDDMLRCAYNCTPSSWAASNDAGRTTMMSVRETGTPRPYTRHTPIPYQPHTWRECESTTTTRRACLVRIPAVMSCTIGITRMVRVPTEVGPALLKTYSDQKCTPRAPARPLPLPPQRTGE